MRRSLIGAKIRERRRALGRTQSSVAAAVGVSGSYLNLIESNKREIGGALLKGIADELGLELGALDGAAERRLVDDLIGLAGEPLLASLRLEPASAEGLAGRHGDWARALIQLHRVALDRNQAISALSDRLNQDPFLGDAVHTMLSKVAAIRSSSEILETVDDLEPAQRERFIAIIGAEASRLSEIAQALAAFFDSSRSGTRSIMPADEVDDFLLERGNHFPALEQAAMDFRAAAGIEGDCRETEIIDYLSRTHSVQVHLRPAHALEPGDRLRYGSFDPAARALTIADAAPRATRRFVLEQVASSLFHQGRAALAEIEGCPLLTTEPARRRALRVLSSYLAAAVLMPYDIFHETTVRSRYDVDHLAQRFGASFEQISHRLTTLRRPGAAGIPFAFMRTDTAGFVTKRLPLPHLLLPRHGNACPLWAIYAAFQSPGAVTRQLVEFPGGDRYLFLARTIEKQRPAFAMPRRLLSVMLACDALYADQTVYADGLDLSAAAPATPVGANCRLCVRRDCAYREEDPIIDA